jgi:hypothetical protein
VGVIFKLQNLYLAANLLALAAVLAHAIAHARSLAIEQIVLVITTLLQVFESVHMSALILDISLITRSGYPLAGGYRLLFRSIGKAALLQTLRSRRWSLTMTSFMSDPSFLPLF